MRAERDNQVKGTVDEAFAFLTQQMGALRKLYESQLEKMRAERDKRVKGAFNEAVSSLTQQMLADRDREMNKTMKLLQKSLENKKNEAAQSLKKTLDESAHRIDESRHEINELCQERAATINAMESVKENVHNHYPVEMEQRIFVQSNPRTLIVRA
jgi:F0F1-type ATP synthase membrane subunit b/b'